MIYLFSLILFINTIFYNVDKTIGVFKEYSALDLFHGTKEHKFKILAVCQKRQEKTYTKYFKTQEEGILLKKFRDVVKV